MEQLSQNLLHKFPNLKYSRQKLVKSIFFSLHVTTIKLINLTYFNFQDYVDEGKLCNSWKAVKMFCFSDRSFKKNFNKTRQKNKFIKKYLKIDFSIKTKKFAFPRFVVDVVKWKIFTIAMNLPLSSKSLIVEAGTYENLRR